MSTSRRSERFESTPFAKGLLREMMAGRGPFYGDWHEGLSPGLREGVDGVLIEDRVRPHPYLAARNSSMAFALNLFLPFRLGDAGPLSTLLSRELGREVYVERLVFEYGGPTHVLGEVAGESPTEDEKFTAADVAVFVRDAEGGRGVVLIEVKLTEGGFTACGGAESNGNRRPDVCASADTFFADPSACYLRHPWRASRDRRYWTIFADAHGSVRRAFPSAAEGGCPFRGDAQQVMRNHALALGLVQAGLADWWAFLLVHHDRNPDVPPPWDAYVAMTADAERFRRVPASEVAEVGSDPAWMAERYRFGGTR